MKKILAILLLFTLPTFSQKYELGNVTTDELQQKTHPLDSNAVACILFRTGKVEFVYSYEDDFEIITTVKTKIKIYKKEGYDWANHSRQYYIGDNLKEKLNYHDAVTYNLVNGKIEKSKLKSEGSFDEKSSRYWNEKKIILPNVKEGSIVEYEYVLSSKRFWDIEKWDFQMDIPINFSELKTYIPNYFSYNLNQKGYVFPIKTLVTKPRTVKYSYVPKIEDGKNNIDRVYSSLEFEEQMATYTIKDVPALKEESYVNNIKNYTSSLSHELSVIRYPNQSPASFSTDWEAVTETIYKDDDFGAELNKTGYFEDDVKSIINGLNSEAETVVALFNYVKSKVKWNGYNGYTCNDGVKKAYKEQNGNAAEINLMLIAMLRFANIDANPVIISTRSNGISSFPSRTAFNYVIVGIEKENNVILLDATDKNSLPNILPIKDLNWNGRIIRKNGSSAEIDLMSKSLSNDFINMIVTIASDGSIEGKIREQHFDYNGYVFRNRFGDTSKESYLEYLEKSINNSEVIDYDVTGKKELSEPIVENYNFKNNNSIEIIGDKMYFSPLLFFATTENPFKQEVREYPVDFVYPNKDRFIINITIPDGYVVETLPASVTIPMTDNLINVKYQIASTGNKIQLSYTKDTNTSIVSSEYYDELKGVFNEIVKKETEKIVLKKI